MKKVILTSTLAFVFSLGAISCKKEKTEEINPSVEAEVATNETEDVVEVNKVDEEIMQKVEDAVKDFPTVKVEDVDGVLILTGEVSATQSRRIKESVDALNIGEYQNNLVVK